MPIAGRLCRCEYWIAGAERVCRNERDLHRDQARRMYEQNHDQRFERAITKLQRNGYGRSRSDTVAVSSDAECGSADQCERSRSDTDAHGCANADDWAELGA